MSDRINHIVNELEQVAVGVQATFGSLSGPQLNWKPAPRNWSVAQCLDHLITINRLYFPLLESLQAGAAKPTAWERFSPFSGLLGRMLITTLSPDNPKKTKTSPKAEPSASDIGEAIVEHFAQHQAELIGHIRALPPDIDRTKTIVTSPLLSWVTYSLDDCLTILTVHEQRHVQQARRVTQTEGFPEAPFLTDRR